MSDKKPAVKMRVNIAGFAGDAITLYAAYDPENDVLLVAKDEPYTPGPRDGFLKISNQARDEARDVLFTEDDLREAITAYFEMDGLRLLNLADKVSRHNPTSRIERDGVDDSGIKYRISPDMTCGQIGVMAACLYANRQRGMQAVGDFFEEMITIGL